MQRGDRLDPCRWSGDAYCTPLYHTWGIAVWTPLFTHFMHEYLAAVGKSAPHKPELFVGDIVQAAIRESLRVEAVHVSDEPFLDIGTPDDLIRAVKRGAKSERRK